MGTASGTIRVEESTKRAVRAIAADFGFDISSIPRAFYTQNARAGGEDSPEPRRVPGTRQEAAEVNALRKTSAFAEKDARRTRLPSIQTGIA